MKKSAVIIGLGLSLILPSFALANDSILQQLRGDGEAVQQLQNIQVNPMKWNNSNGLLASNNSQVFSAKAQRGSYSPSSNLNVEAVITWNSENIFRGIQESKQTVAGGIEISSDNLYAGVWALKPTADSFNAYQDRVDIYAGYGFDLGEVMQGDIGVTGYLRSDNSALFAYDDSMEVYAGVSFGGEFNPALYAFYDVVLERFNLEASAEYIMPIARTDLVFGGTAGYSNDNGFDFGYIQIDVEIVQNFNRNLSIGLGGHFAASTEPTYLQGLALSGKNTTWFGLRLRASK